MPSPLDLTSFASSTTCRSSIARRRMPFSLSPQRGEGRGEGWDGSKPLGAEENHRLYHPSPSIPLPVEERARLALLAALIVFTSGGALHAADEPPKEWIEPATGHKVVRLSREP